MPVPGVSVGLNEGENLIAILVTAANGVTNKTYTVSVTHASFVHQAYIKASNTEADDEFSTGMALFGNTLAVGAFGNSGATGINGDQNNTSSLASGAVYVFTRIRKHTESASLSQSLRYEYQC